MRLMLRASRGAAFVEYGILIGLIAVLAIAAVFSLGGRVQTSFKSPAATLGWFNDGVSGEAVARYRFRAAQSPDNPQIIGFNDGYVGTAYGTMEESSFTDLELLSAQYIPQMNQIRVTMAGDTVSTAAGHRLSCIDLSLGDPFFTMDFDTVPGNYDFFNGYTSYGIVSTEAPFSLDQELACTVAKK